MILLQRMRPSSQLYGIIKTYNGFSKMWDSMEMGNCVQLTLSRSII